MLPISYFVTIVLVSQCQSYEVNFNEILSNALSGARHVNFGQRFKRNPPPHHKMDCCGAPPVEDREMIKECFKKRQKRDQPEGGHGKGGGGKGHHGGMGLCVAECIAKKHNFANDNGIVDKATFVEEYKKFDTDTWRQEQVEKSYDTCIETAEKFKVKITKKHPNSECNAQVAGFLHCQMREIISNCPDDKFKADNEFCAKIKKKSKNQSDESEDDL